ncbi:M1 family aminopeptidase [Spirosoma montaniterrae]|uniref:Aminopeptidase N n=1 Tax=Spirosoma montaniterrae TaxID=1178516 RepID=A0A1P9WY91_9BACT|nr:M1 family aminopeptidase [Spirosoma montaniterrae]AQG80352.1 peptidase M1 [Spirosoma montaniterrae]
MKKLYLLLCLLPFFANSQALEETATDACRSAKVRAFGRLASNPRARVAYPGDAAIDITYYGLDLRLTHTPNYLRGAATIRFKNTSASLSSFYFDCNPQLTVDSVVNAGRRLAFVRGTDRVTITPTQPLSSGQTLAVTIYYQGNPASQSGFGSFAFSTHGPTNTPVIWSLSEPYGASDWFPCKDTPADKADSSAVSITADKQFVSVSNGVLLGTADNPDGTRTYRWRNSYPIAQYLISIAMTNYERYDTPFTYDGQTMPVVHYIYPETLPNIRPNLDRTTDMLRVFSNLFGPYPFLREKYGHAQFGWGGGMEHQTISSMGGWTTGLIAHELAHQWFGNKITCRDWQSIWLNEGFASYAEALYPEAVSGPAAYSATMNSFLNSARNARGTLYVQDITSVNSIFNSNRTYAKGTTVLHMLRWVLGDNLFFQTLRAYAASPTVAYGTAVTEDFQAIAQQVSSRNLDYFFKQWIFGEGYPTYRATVSPGASASTVSVRLEQRNTIATNPASFTMPVQLRIQSAAGDTTVTVLNDLADQTFVVPTRGPVTGVVVDPNNRILKATDPTVLPGVVTAIPEPLSASLNAYPNPAAETLTVEFTTSSAGPITLSLSNVLGQRVLTKDERLPAGRHTRTLTLRGLSAGQYTLRVDTEAGPQSRVVLVR